MTDRGEALRIELEEERFTIPEARVVRAKMRFENLPPFTDRLEPAAANFAIAIIAPQVAERLFAFKNRCRSNLPALTAIGGHISSIPASWQTHFDRAHRKSLRLRPHHREPFQPGVSRGFTISAYSRSHFASSRAQ
jgi:hypothetical protein